MKTAKRIKRIEGWKSDAWLYELSEPIVDYDEGKHSHVIVSAVVAMYSGPETYIFPATADGEIVSWGELDGSFRGALDHNQALENAGYSVQE